MRVAKFHQQPSGLSKIRVQKSSFVICMCPCNYQYLVIVALLITKKKKPSTNGAVSPHNYNITSMVTKNTILHVDCNCIDIVAHIT